MSDALAVCPSCVSVSAVFATHRPERTLTPATEIRERDARLAQSHELRGESLVVVVMVVAVLPLLDWK